MTTTTKTQATQTEHPRAGYRVHDGRTDWQECDSCGLRLGAGITTQWDAAYYADDHDPADCPRCKDGLMCLPIVER